MCACMYAEIMWDCSYTCMYVHCVYIRTNANLVSVRTRLIGASLILAMRLTSSCMYLSMYVSMHTSLPPETPNACSHLIFAHFSLYSTKVFAVDIMDSSYTVEPR